MRVAVIGATGLVGATLVERLLQMDGCDVLPFIHSSGNAWRLARLGIEMRQLNLLDAAQVYDALRTCTHVVNCSRGDNEVMLKGLQHLLSASKRNGIHRFVHLSSVMVYGDPPHPESARECAPTGALKDSYGWVKLRQDEMIERACDRGLPCTVLCPPNISGPYSYYILGVLNALKQNSFAPLDAGDAPCVLVDVFNLVHSIELSLENGPSNGQRIFVTDDELVTWRQVIEELAPLLPDDFGERIPIIDRSTLTELAKPKSKPVSVINSLKHLVSSDIRAALRKDPMWLKADAGLRRAVARLGKGTEDYLRLSIEGPTQISKATPFASINIPLSSHQLRGVIHDCALAKETLGYRPRKSFLESMAAFRDWYDYHSGKETEFADLLHFLH